MALTSETGRLIVNAVDLGPAELCSVCDEPIEDCECATCTKCGEPVPWWEQRSNYHRCRPGLATTASTDGKAGA